MKHFGDPCIHCGLGHDEILIGDCEGDPERVRAIAYRIVERRWDGYLYYYVLYSDGRAEDIWQHHSYQLPRYHFDYRKEWQEVDLRYEPTLKLKSAS